MEVGLVFDPRRHMHGAERFLGDDNVSAIRSYAARSATLCGDEPRLLMDVATRKAVRREKLPLEARLQQSQWFDYRFCHPLEATCWYLFEFERSHVENYAKFIDAPEASKHRGIGNISHLLVGRASMVSAAWEGRSRFDALGIEYRFAFRNAMERFVDKKNRDHVRLPQLNQIYGVGIIEYVTERWTEFNDLGLRSPKTGYYRNENYCGERAQNLSHDRVVARLTRNPREEPRHRLINTRLYVYDQGILTEERAAKEFGASIIDPTQNRLGAQPEQDLLTANPSDFRPGCFGFYFEENNKPEFCAPCTYLEHCRARTADVDALMLHLFEDIDPRLSEKRRLARDRQRARRARSRQANDIPVVEEESPE